MTNEKPMSHLPKPSGSEPTIVTIDVRRHPDKYGDALTELGEEQIRTVGKRDHSGMRYNFYGYSGAERTYQTLWGLMEESGVNPRDYLLIPVPGMHYEHVEELACVDPEFWGPAEEKIQTGCAETGEQETIGHWRDAYPNYFLIARVAVATTLMNIACMIAASGGHRGLIASHSPASETAAPNNFPRLPVSAGVRYTFEVTGGKAVLMGSRFLEPADENCISAAMPSMVTADAD